jgi:serine/threonine protein kinase
MLASSPKSITFLCVVDGGGVSRLQSLRCVHEGSDRNTWLCINPQCEKRLLRLSVALSASAAVHIRNAHAVSLALIAGGCADLARFVCAGTVDGLPAIVTEWVDGCSLWELVTTQGPVPRAQVQRWYTSLERDLQRVHALGIVHRDLTPANVVVKPDQSATPIDWGLAAFIKSQVPTPSVGLCGGRCHPWFAGTNDYASLRLCMSFAAHGLPEFARMRKIGTLKADAASWSRHPLASKQLNSHD